MKTFWSKVNKPLPGWMTLVLICGALSANAAVPLYTGRVVAAASASPSAVPLTVAAASAQFADVADFCSTLACASKYAWIDSAGSLNALAASPSASFSGQNGPVVVAQATGAPTAQPGNVDINGFLLVKGAEIMVAAGTTNVIPASAGQPFNVSNAANTENNLQVNNNGGVQATTTGSSTLGFLSPVYTAAGASTVGTLHGVLTTCAFAGTTSCTVTLTGAAVFSSITSYTCAMDNPNSTTPSFVSISNASGSSFVLTVAAGSSATVAVSCIGA